MNTMALQRRVAAGQMGGTGPGIPPVHSYSMAIKKRRYGGQMGEFFPMPTNSPVYSTIYGPSPSYFPSSPTIPVTPAGTPPPPSQGVTSNGMQIFNSVSSLVSQILAGWSRNPTNQVYGPGVGVISNPNVLMTQAASNAAVAQSHNQQYAPGGGYGPGGNSLGGGVGQGLDGLIGWATANPMIVFLVVGGAILLFRQPPGKR